MSPRRVRAYASNRGIGRDDGGPSSTVAFPQDATPPTVDWIELSPGTRKDVSIVVVNFNSGAYLPGCLGSIARQELDGLELELLVVDNASPTDQTAALAEAEAAGARVLRQSENTGYAGGCNRGSSTRPAYPAISTPRGSGSPERTTRAPAQRS